jgi:hypothetical protein
VGFASALADRRFDHLSGSVLTNLTNIAPAEPAQRPGGAEVSAGSAQALNRAGHRARSERITKSACKVVCRGHRDAVKSPSALLPALR